MKGFVRLVCSATLCSAAALALGAGGSAQGSQTLHQFPGCPVENVDIRLHFYRAPNDMHVVALDYRNKGDFACTLSQYRNQKGYPTSIPLPNHQETHPPLTVLAPGASAHSTLRWQTETPSNAASCEKGWWRGGHNLVVAGSAGRFSLTSPMLWPRACSKVVDDEDYHAGVFVPEWKPSSDLAPPLPRAPSLAVGKADYFENEALTLHTVLNDRTGDDPSCPVMLEMTRNAEGNVQIEEVVNPFDDPFDNNPYWKTRPHTAWERCHMSYPYKGAQNEFNFRVQLGNGLAWRGLGPHRFNIIELAGFSEDGEYRQVSSNEVSVNVISAEGIPRVWGKTERGVRADLTLDKLTYKLGEDVPLHIATEVVSSTAPLYDRPFDRRTVATPERFWRPSVVLEDDNGAVKPKQILWAGSIRPLPCPKPLEDGVVMPLELQLSDEGLLPEKPGRYRITVKWSVYAAESTECKDFTTGASVSDKDVYGRPFVTVTSEPLMFEVVAKP